MKTVAWSVCNMHGPWYPPTFIKLSGNMLMSRSYDGDWRTYIVSDPDEVLRTLDQNPNAKRI